MPPCPQAFPDEIQHGRLTPVKMGASGGIAVETVRSVERGQRRQPDQPGAQIGQRGSLCFRVFFCRQKIRHQGAGLCQRHSGCQSGRERSRTDTGDGVTVMCQRVHNERPVGRKVSRAGELEALGAPEGHPESEKAAHDRCSRGSSEHGGLPSPATA